MAGQVGRTVMAAALAKGKTMLCCVVLSALSKGCPALRCVVVRFSFVRSAGRTGTSLVHAMICPVQW